MWVGNVLNAVRACVRAVLIPARAAGCGEIHVHSVPIHASDCEIIAERARLATHGVARPPTLHFIHSQ